MNSQTLRSLACAAVFFRVDRVRPDGACRRAAGARQPRNRDARNLALGQRGRGILQQLVGAMWFRGGVGNPAAARLVSVLKRAQFDGLSSGPQLAREVEAAIARASTGKPADVMASEQVLSSAWVLYVQTLKRPTPNMIYGYSVLEAAEQPRRPDPARPPLRRRRSKRMCSGRRTSIRPTRRIRDAAWLQAQATGVASGPAPARQPRARPRIARRRPLRRGRFRDAALTMYENGVAGGFDEGRRRHARAADATDRQHDPLRDVQSILERAAPSGAQDRSLPMCSSRAWDISRPAAMK